ncbi:MAG: DNA repair protein RadC [Candidatus Pacebacteria bacterium]|nr:DNA repair protein RadC [Candidatus Paceibacterota bacterium]
MKMKDAPKYARPREKLARYGVGKLTNHELLAIVLGSGTQGTNVVQLAKKIVNKVEEVGLESLTIKDLTSIKGLGMVKAGQVLAALEYGRRQHAAKDEVVMTPEKVFELCADFRNSRKEHFVAFYCNSRGALIAREIISIGTLDASLVHPREVFEPALRHSAASIIVAHNHPSGDSECSHEDVEITKQLQHASKLLGIDLIDHVIVSRGGWTSVL